MAELSLKCLLKLVKVLNVTISDLHLDAVLRELHLFFVAHPAPSWKLRTDEVPYDTARTILDRIVKLKGADVCKHFSLIPAITTTPQPVIYSYVHQLIRAHFPDLAADEATAERILTEDVAKAYTELLGAGLYEPTPVWSDGPLLPALAVPTQPQAQPQIFITKPATAPQIKEALSVIHNRMLVPESVQQALTDLAYLRRDHDTAIDLPGFLAGFSPQFASFIQQSLTKLEKTVGFENVPPSNAPVAVLAEAYKKRLDAVRNKMGLHTSSEIFYPKTTTRSLSAFSSAVGYVASSTPMNSAFTSSNVSLGASQPPPALGNGLSRAAAPAEKSSITALRERLKQAASADPGSIDTAAISSVSNISALSTLSSMSSLGTSSIPVTVAAPVVPTAVPVAEPEPINVPLSASSSASSSNTAGSSSLAALRERLARIKGSQ